MDRIDAIETFVRVADAGGISAAARRLHVAKSVVSRRLAELEAHLGARLVHRTTRRMALTEAGQAFLDRARGILADLAEAEEAVGQAQAALRGRLRLAAPLSFGVTHLTPALTDFLQAYPGIRLETAFSDRQVDLVAEGFDIALRIGRPTDSTLIGRRLAPIRQIVCASPGYWDQAGRPHCAADLAGHTGLRYARVPDPAIWRFRDPNGRSGQVPVPIRLLADNGDLLRAAALAGLGVIVEPTFIVYRDIAEGRLEPVLTDHTWSVGALTALWPPSPHLPRRVRALVDFLAARFGERPYWDAAISASAPGSVSH